MQKKKGISLIVLVITIIVMIILAAAIILSLNNAGIIGNANKAVSETDYKNVQTAAQLVYADMMLSETEKPSMMLRQGEYIKQKLISQGTITADQASMYRFKNNGEVVKLQSKAEYEEMYKDELAMLDSTYYTITDGVFSLNNIDDLNTLRVLAIPYGVTRVVTNGDRFNELTELLKVIMPDTVSEFSMDLYNATKLKDIRFSKNLKKYNVHLGRTKWHEEAERENGLLIVEGILIDGNNTIGQVVIPNNVEVIHTEAFDSAFNITSVVIPDTVELIEEFAFSTSGCGGLELIFEENSKLEEVKFLGQIPEIRNFAFAYLWDLPETTQEIINIVNPMAMDGANCLD